MAKQKKKSAYEEMKESLIGFSQYGQGLEALTKNSEAVNLAAKVAEDNGASQAANTLLSHDPYRDTIPFLEAGQKEAKDSFEKFTKDRSKLEEILSDKQFAPVLEGLLFSYEPKLPKNRSLSKKYESVVKLHKEVGPMHRNVSAHEGEKLSKAESEQIYVQMASYSAKEIEKKYSKKPLFLKAMLQLVGCDAEVSKDGKSIKIRKDKKGNIQVTHDHPRNKDFAFLMYSEAYQEKMKEFKKAIGNDYAKYISETLPEDEIPKIYENLVRYEMESKRK